MIEAGLLNTLWMIKCAGELRRFRAATKNVACCQSDILRRILGNNRDTHFGQLHGFASINGPGEFQRRVPISTYSDYQALIDRIANGEANVLTREQVRLLEPTSGTTEGEKLIPYTDGLRAEFQRGIAAWIADLLWNHPRARAGRAYWSVSPALGNGRTTAGGIPIGFDHDAAYLGRWERAALDRLLVNPAGIASVSNLDNFRYLTLLFLLSAEDLSLVSVWNPTFLTALLAGLEPWFDRLCHDISTGLVSTLVALEVGSVDGMALSQARIHLRPQPKRAQQLLAVMRGANSRADFVQQAWPRLALISCWADAMAAPAAQELQRTFAQSQLQPKGLLSTEAFVSLPLAGCPGAALAIRSHFFEFQEVDGDAAPCRLAHELELNSTYRVLVTTSGGLYRYQTGDEVKVVGFTNQCPLVRFAGRGSQTSDLVGEKLSESFVGASIGQALANVGLAARFAMLVPVTGEQPCYRLYLQLAHELSADGNARLCAELESALAANPHYRYARGLGQLHALELELLDTTAFAAAERYQEIYALRGKRVGDIKPLALDSWQGWHDVFCPRKQTLSPSADKRACTPLHPAASP